MNEEQYLATVHEQIQAYRYSLCQDSKLETDSAMTYHQSLTEEYATLKPDRCKRIGHFRTRAFA